jgi:hypothetical protein
MLGNAFSFLNVSTPHAAGFDNLLVACFYFILCRYQLNSNKIYMAINRIVRIAGLKYYCSLL